MAFLLTKPFANYGQQGNEAGVCEAAVCLWQRRIKENVGTFQWGYSAGDWIPTPAASNQLYLEFNGNPSPYLYTYESYLADHVYDAAKAHPGDAVNAPTFVACCHYSGLTDDWNATLGAMAKGDTLMLSLTGAHSAHSIGVYRGSDYIFVFDPNFGLYEGNAWRTTGCRGRNHDLAHAAAHIQGQCAGHQWTTRKYLGVHLRVAQPGQ